MVSSAGSGSSLPSLPSTSPAVCISASSSLGSPDGPGSPAGESGSLLSSRFSPSSPSSPSSSVANPEGRFFHRRLCLPERNKGFVSWFDLGKNEGWLSRTTPPRVVVGRVGKGSSSPTNSECPKTAGYSFFLSSTSLNRIRVLVVVSGARTLLGRTMSVCRK
jgi:hypothetical protein